MVSVSTFLPYSYYTLQFVVVFHVSRFVLPLIEQKYPNFNIHYAPIILFECFYWFYAITHMIMDRTPNWWWGKYKVVQKETITDIQMLPNVIFNHLFLIVSQIIYTTYIGRGAVTEYNISIFTPILELAFYYLLFDVAFYYGHRFLHMPVVFEAIHKKHHLTKGSVGISGFYMHPLDYFLEGILPSYLGPFILNGHLLSGILYSSLNSINSPQSHGGYCFPFLPPPDDHYNHHKYYNKNFALGVLDCIHGTNFDSRGLLTRGQNSEKDT